MFPGDLIKMPLFAGLNETEMQCIDHLSAHRFYNKNEMIIFEGEPESRFSVLLQGRVKISRFTEEGKEAIYSFLGEGEFFGESCVFQDQIWASSVVSLEPVHTLNIYRDDLLRMMQQIPLLNINLLREMTVRLRRRNAQIKSLTTHNATGKVASTLLRLVDDLGISGAGRIEIENLPTHRDIANMIGTSRETISRVMRNLRQSGYIRKENGRLIICDYQRFRRAFN
jgi:CRP/FNR family cyclic AMP-dependent transcriptional regulator